MIIVYLIFGLINVNYNMIIDNYYIRAKLITIHLGNKYPDIYWNKFTLLLKTIMVVFDILLWPIDLVYGIYNLLNKK